MNKEDDSGSVDEEDLGSIGVNKAIKGRISLHDVAKYSKPEASDFGATLTSRRLEAKPYQGSTADWTNTG